MSVILRQEFMKNLWRWVSNKEEIDITYMEKIPEDEHDFWLSKDFLKQLITTSRSSEFIQYMKNRMFFGCIRYGYLRRRNRPYYHTIPQMIKRFNIYKETGNCEMLIDCANFCGIEYIYSIHPNKHYEELDGVRHDTFDSVFDYIESYKQTGNLKYLVVIANITILEFEFGEHPNKHFEVWVHDSHADYTIV